MIHIVKANGRFLRFYDITLNSSRLGIEGSAEIIGKYIDEYIMRRKNG